MSTWKFEGEGFTVIVHGGNGMVEIKKGEHYMAFPHEHLDDLWKLLGHALHAKS